MPVNSHTHMLRAMYYAFLACHCRIRRQFFPLPMKYINLLKCPDCFRSAGTFVADEINFQLLADAVAFIIGAVLHDNTHIHMEPPHFQLIENDILHAVSFFNLTEIQPGIAKSHICKIILYRRINVFLSLYIISNCAVAQEGITEIINILLDCRIADFLIFDRSEGCLLMSVCR